MVHAVGEEDVIQQAQPRVLGTFIEFVGSISAAHVSLCRDRAQAARVRKAGGLTLLATGTSSHSSAGRPQAGVGQSRNKLERFTTVTKPPTDGETEARGGKSPAKISR